MQSPSGRTWPTTQIVWLCRMPPRMRSIIFGWGFIRRVGAFQFLDNFEDFVAFPDRFVELETQLWCVFQDNRPANQSLDPFAVFEQPFPAPFPLVRVAQNTKVNRGVLQVPAHIDLVD